jgi:hypothetical protein
MIAPRKFGAVVKYNRALLKLVLRRCRDRIKSLLFQEIIESSGKSLRARDWYY